MGKLSVTGMGMRDAGRGGGLGILLMLSGLSMGAVDRLPVAVVMSGDAGIL